MLEEKQNPWKMKLTGYICILFALILTCLVAFGVTETERIQVTVSLIGTWLLAGTSLLTVNAGKRILGGIAMSKEE